MTSVNSIVRTLADASVTAIGVGDDARVSLGRGTLAEVTIVNANASGRPLWANALLEKDEEPTRRHALGPPKACRGDGNFGFRDEWNWRGEIALKSGTDLLFAIANSGTGPLAWRFSPSATWMRYSRFNGVALGSDIGAQPSAVTLFADASGLPLGSYTGTITVSTLYGSGSPKTINIITLVVPQRAFVPGVTRD